MITKPNRSKPLVFIIVLLLLANIAGVIFNFVMMRKNHEPRHTPVDRKALIGKYLKDDLKFTDAQLKAYENLSTIHESETKPLFDSLRAEKEKRMKFLVAGNFEDSAINLAVTRSSERQQALDRKMLTRIKNIRAICTDAQRASFDTGFFNMMDRNRPDKKNKKTNK